jgi:hypothetical protein
MWSVSVSLELTWYSSRLSILGGGWVDFSSINSRKHCDLQPRVQFSAEGTVNLCYNNRGFHRTAVNVRICHVRIGTL